MARLARDVEIGPAGRIGIGGEVVVLLQIGGMATGALVVPGLVAAGPVQWVTGLDLLSWVEVEPALAALLFRPAVPGDAERLQPLTGKSDQVLLQRIDAESVGDRIVVQCAIGAAGADHELVAIAEEDSRDPKMVERRVGEVTEHRCRRRGLHCQGMVRALPGIELRGVTAGAGLRANKNCRLIGARGYRPGQRQHDHNGQRRLPQGALGFWPYSLPGARH